MMEVTVRCNDIGIDWSICFCVWRCFVRNDKCKVLENKHFNDTNFAFCNFELDAIGCGKGSISRAHETLRVIRILTVEECTAISSWRGSCTRCVEAEAVPRASTCQSTGERRMGIKCIAIYHTLFTCTPLAGHRCENVVSET